MNPLLARGLTAALALSLAGCAAIRPAPDIGGMDVYRTHLSQPIAPAPISVEPFNPADAARPEFAIASAAVERELARLGYRLAETRGTSERIAMIEVRQGARGALTHGWPGDLREGSSDPTMVATLLDVRLRRRSDATVYWQGRAVMEAPAGSPDAQAGVAAEKLAEAMFRDFPGESGRTIRLR